MLCIEQLRGGLGSRLVKVVCSYRSVTGSMCKNLVTESFLIIVFINNKSTSTTACKIGTCRFLCSATAVTNDIETAGLCSLCGSFLLNIRGFHTTLILSLIDLLYCFFLSIRCWYLWLDIIEIDCVICSCVFSGNLGWASTLRWWVRSTCLRICSDDGWLLWIRSFVNGCWTS